MGASGLCNLQKVRATLDVSQSELADLLGISVRAIQSYEQGWRDCPPYVQKLVGLLLQARHARGKKTTRPCWQIKKCSDQLRQKCVAYRLGQGHICWLITGNFHQADRQKSWEAKLARCRECSVMQAWMGQPS